MPPNIRHSFFKKYAVVLHLFAPLALLIKKINPSVILPHFASPQKIL